MYDVSYHCAYMSAEVSASVEIHHGIAGCVDVCGCIVGCRIYGVGTAKFGRVVCIVFGFTVVELVIVSVVIVVNVVVVVFVVVVSTVDFCCSSSC